MTNGSDDELDWVFAISRAGYEVAHIPGTAVDETCWHPMVWLDDACFDHACGLDFLDNFVLRPGNMTCIRVANGEKLTHLGDRVVQVYVKTKAGDAIKLGLTLRVLNIKRALLSVSRLAKAWSA